MCGATGATPKRLLQEDTVPSELLFQFVVVELFQLIWQHPFHATDIVPLVEHIAALDITLTGYPVDTGVEEVPEFKFFSVHFCSLFTNIGKAFDFALPVAQ